MEFFIWVFSLFIYRLFFHSFSLFRRPVSAAEKVFRIYRFQFTFLLRILFALGIYKVTLVI